MEPDKAGTLERQAIAALFSRGELDEAIRLARDLTRRYPADGYGWNALGSALATQGNTADAIAPMEQAAALMPGDATVLSNLGAALTRLDKIADAEGYLRRALQLRPRHLDAAANLGVILRRQGHLGQAVACFEGVLRAAPDHAPSHNNLGLVLHDLGRFDEAAASYRRALQAKPHFAEALNNLSITLQHLGRLAEAQASCRAALDLQPDLAQGHANLAVILQAAGRFDEALRCCRRALEIRPDYTQAQSILLFGLNYAVVRTADALAEARRFGSMVAATARVTQWPVPPAAVPERLRVGFVSGDLREHPVGYFLENLLIHIDRARIELHAYSTGGVEGAHEADPLTARIKPHFAAWKSLAGLSDEEAARLIADDALHVLVDLAGHTAGNRLPVFAWKPAPLQVSWLGYFATTGVTQIDYLIADPWTVPPADEVQFTERVWRLPHTRMCFTPPSHDLDISPLPLLANGGVTFGCFNNLSKVNDAVVASWSRLLRRLPASRLILMAGQLLDPTVRAETAARFGAHGIGAEQLLLEKPASRHEYLRNYQRVDIALDPFPFTGATTTAEALWMGVPVITLRGDRMVSRQGAGLLANCGLPDWVADDPDDYVRRTVEHAGNPDALAALRKGLRARVLASAIFDGARFARDFEAALRGMWQEVESTGQKRDS